MSTVTNIELIVLYILWRLGLIRRLIDRINALLTRVANGREGSARRFASSLVRVADYLELTRGSRLTPGAFWIGYLIVGSLLAQILAGGSGDDALRVMLLLFILVIVFAVLFAFLVGSSLYVRAAQKNMERMLPEALATMGDEISAGHAVEAAVQRVALQFGKPLSQEFTDALIKMVASGGLISIDVALAEIAQNPLYQSDALDQAALTISVVRPLGGDLGALLNDLAKLLHAREATQREIRTQLAPGRQAAWSLIFIIGGLQIALTLFPLFSNLLWGTYAGRTTLIAASVVIGLSIYWIVQINSADV